MLPRANLSRRATVVDLWYNFVLTGPGGVDVPVLFDVSLLANSGQTSQYSLNTAQASIRVTPPVEQRSIEVHCGTAFQYSDCANKQFSQTISVKPQAGGYIGDINLHADATSSGGEHANVVAENTPMPLQIRIFASTRPLRTLLCTPSP
jgi:hypothetical protein